MPHYDYDKDYPFAAFITNLGKYNEGALVGEWVKFPTTAEELKKVFERIGIGSKDEFGQTYEEWFITDYDCYVDGLYDLLGEYLCYRLSFDLFYQLFLYLKCLVPATHK